MRQKVEAAGLLWARPGDNLCHFCHILLGKAVPEPAHIGGLGASTPPLHRKNVRERVAITSRPHSFQYPT